MKLNSLLNCGTRGIRIVDGSIFDLLQWKTIHNIHPNISILEKIPGWKELFFEKRKKKKAGSLLQRSILMVDFGARNGKGRGDKRAPIKIDMKSRIHVEGTPLYR